MSFVERLDPALAPVSTDTAGVDVAVHVVARHTPFFTDISKKGTLIADPVEVLLDLTDLRMVTQAEEFVRHIRSQRP